MSFWSKVRSLILWCSAISVFSAITAFLGFSAYIVPTLYEEYKSDSPWNTSAPSVQAEIERLLYRDIWNIFPLTTYNYKSMLRLTEDQNFMKKDHRHIWIYITGNQTCSSAEECTRFDAAFDEVTEKYYLSPPANNASIFTLNCDTSPFLCSAWAATPPALIRVESLGFPHCKISFPHLQCPYGVRYIPLPTGQGMARMLGSYSPVDGIPDARWQLRSLFESTCAHEVYIIQRLLEFAGNGGEPEEFDEIFGDLIAGFPIAEQYGKLFSWWLGEGGENERDILDDL
ncbi:hypothetical protein WHR41_07627 [Cladosporium halotolerans]|uniref:Uncharacterized protein n=1 Tax=Cladosporium halotolerans TaxID=1052096 RepID=A0AB34KE19_9PEZI